MSDLSPRLALPFILPAQAQKHVTHNEALTRLDLVTQLTVMAFGATQPPSLPAEGEIWALGPGASGAWAGHDGALAAWIGDSWQFITPAPGWRAASGTDLRIWTGSAWTPLATADLENVPGLGVNTGFDATNRLSVSAPATLLSHEGADHQLKINKAAPGDTASLLFQTDWAGRAEMGLAGSDDFAVKVSADGALWNDGLVVDAASGAVTMPNGASIDGVLTGSVVAQSSVDNTAGRVPINRPAGIFGLGAVEQPPRLSDFDAISTPSGFYRFNTTTMNPPPEVSGGLGYVFILREGANRITQFYWLRSTSPLNSTLYQRRYEPSSWGDSQAFWSTHNTTVDGNGFLLEASPVLRLFADRIEEPTTPVGASMQRLGPGHYALSGCPPLATEGWRTRGAGDGDGNIICTVEPPVWVDDILHLRTMVDGVPADVPEGRFVMLRFWAPQEEGEAPPPVDAISAADFELLLLAAHKGAVSRLIDRQIEAQARALGYNNAARLTSYVASGVADWATEAQTFVAWRDQVWQAAIHIMDQANPADPPSAEAVLARLPVWPG